MEFTHNFCNGIDRVGGPGLDAAVSRVGAELVALRWNRPDGASVDVLWRNGQVDPPRDGYWRRHAPILFPIVGGIHGNRSVTTGGDPVHFEGLHGFLRSRDMIFKGASVRGREFALGYELVSDDATREMYPWDFRVLVEYLFSTDGVAQTIAVTNLGTRDMPFQAGWHPGINVPLLSGTKGDCHLRLPRGRIARMLNDADCHLTGESVLIDSSGDFRFNENELELTYMFDVGSVAPADRVVEILDRDCAAGVRVRFPDYPHLGIWSDAGAPFICVEPWQGMDDSVVQEPFDMKFGMVMLPPGVTRTMTATIEFLSGQEPRR